MAVDWRIARCAWVVETMRFAGAEAEWRMDESIQDSEECVYTRASSCNEWSP